MGNVACMEVASISVLSTLLQFMAAIKVRVQYQASFTYDYDIQWSVLLSVNITALSCKSVAIAEVGTVTAVGYQWLCISISIRAIK